MDERERIEDRRDCGGMQENDKGDSGGMQEDDKRDSGEMQRWFWAGARERGTRRGRRLPSA